MHSRVNAAQGVIRAHAFQGIIELPHLDDIPGGIDPAQDGMDGIRQRMIIGNGTANDGSRHAGIVSDDQVVPGTV